MTCNVVKLEGDGDGVTKEEQSKIDNGDQKMCGQVVVSCITDEGAVRTRPAERKQVSAQHTHHMTSVPCCSCIV